MKKIFKTIGMILLCLSLAVPVSEARGRNNGGSGSQQTRPSTGNQTQQRPGNNGRGSGTTQRNNNNNTRQQPQHNNNNRPGQNNNSRPNNPGGSGYNDNNRPGYNNHNGFNPGDNRRPPQTNHHGHGPTHRDMPPPRPFHRPTPPPHWSPAPGWHAFNTILGITFGTGLNVSVSYLMNNGYSVYSYGNDVVYLLNVNMLNMVWPDAVLYYNTAGGLYASQFVYSTPTYSMSRYNSAYSMLIGTYGSPVSVENTSAGIEATWWGTNNQFIRLSYLCDYSSTGSLRYYTSLSFGN